MLYLLSLATKQKLITSLSAIGKQCFSSLCKHSLKQLLEFPQPTGFICASCQWWCYAFSKQELLCVHKKKSKDNTEYFYKLSVEIKTIFRETDANKRTEISTENISSPDLSPSALDMGTCSVDTTHKQILKSV